ncbi:type II toxin-antitoxin system RelE/ParE family toxin [Streptomyces sp. NPDC096136]|uniref:type II toxin-antitoxin system RelE family toxin n=1 Tax=Streptomyces sp. NPDC096136 TaxID=3366076 RepID=UPI00380665E1
MPQPGRPTYRVEFTESAAAVRDTLPAERRAQLARGIRVLARDPYTKYSAPIGPDDYSRKAMVAESLLIEYGILEGVMIVIVVAVLDDMQFIADDED